MSVKDLIAAAMNKDAAAFESTLQDVMADKMSVALSDFLAPAEVQEEEVEEDLGEEAGQIDELSKKTLGSYIKAANRDTYVPGKYSKDDKDARAAGRKRKAGVALAVNKLIKN